MITCRKINNKAQDIIMIQDNIIAFKLMKDYVNYIPPKTISLIPLGYEITIESNMFASIFLNEDLINKGLMSMSTQALVHPFKAKELMVSIYNTRSYTVYLDQNKPLCYLVVRPLATNININFEE